MGVDQVNTQGRAIINHKRCNVNGNWYYYLQTGYLHYTIQRYAFPRKAWERES